jgi:hypothetical protein
LAGAVRAEVEPVDTDREAAVVFLPPQEAHDTMPTTPKTSPTTEIPAVADADEPLPLNQPAMHEPRQEIKVAQPPWITIAAIPLADAPTQSAP